ncbi:SOS response-associated peptidase [Arcanobacterium haemolyticum]|nr:SOS response-associated peptidase [Arcanobacterium haemolyticum]
MCGRYASFMTTKDLQLEFDLDTVPDEFVPSWNVAPTQDVPVVVERVKDTGRVRELYAARWGLVPPWSKNPQAGPSLINARVETLRDKRVFAPALAKRRCIVPANGYFEWQTSASGKQPYYIHDERLLAFAGLYEWWKAPDGTWLLSTTIVTTSARSELSFIHDRSPVLLERGEYSSWLSPATSADEAYALLTRTNRLLRAEPVGQGVGNPRHNSPHNIEAVRSHGDDARLVE